MTAEELLELDDEDRALLELVENGDVTRPRSPNIDHADSTEDAVLRYTLTVDAPESVASDSIRRAWVVAVLEGRWSTAAYLWPDLPPVELTEVIRVPEDQRDSFATKGEIV